MTKHSTHFARKIGEIAINLPIVECPFTAAIAAAIFLTAAENDFAI